MENWPPQGAVTETSKCFSFMEDFVPQKNNNELTVVQVQRKKKKERERNNCKGRMGYPKLILMTGVGG